MNGLTVHATGSNHAVATLEDRLVIGLFQKTPDLSGANAYLDAGQRAVTAHPTGVAFLTIAKDPGRPPDPQTREVFARMMIQFQGPSLASAIVTMGGNPIGMSVVRAVMTGLLMLARHNTPTRMFGSLVDAGTWMAQEGAAQKVQFPAALHVERAAQELARAVGGAA
jgi:hypothetical protein